MNLEAALSQAIRAVVAEAWPEAVENGIYRARQITRVTAEKLPEKVPYVVVSIALQESADFPVLTARTKQGPVTISYVSDDSLHDEDDLLPKLEALRVLLWPAAGEEGALSFGQVLSDPELSIGEDLPMNRHFQALQRSFLAGQLTTQVLVGETL